LGLPLGGADALERFIRRQRLNVEEHDDDNDNLAERGLL
jgi:hypothetical protein